MLRFKLCGWVQLMWKGLLECWDFALSNGTCAISQRFNFFFFSLRDFFLYILLPLIFLSFFSFNLPPHRQRFLSPPPPHCQHFNPKWDNYLASLGLIPNTTVTEIQELLEDEQKYKLKTIIADIANNIMDTNIDIWKHRCKILYSNWQAVT